MAIRKVAQLGHPVLRRIADPVPERLFGTPELEHLVADMIETMHDYQGVGLAAPQIHESLRLAVVETGPNLRYPDAPEEPLTVLVNPEIVARSVEVEEDWEGCLSLGALRGVVPRHVGVTVRGVNLAGRELAIEAEGFYARAIQHELDHLDGIVFPDRMRDLKTLGFPQ